MPDEVPETGGAETGEPTPAPAAPEADGSRELADEVIKSLDAPAEAPAAAAPLFDPDIWKKLENISPRDLPESVRKKWEPELEAPFLSRYTTKTTEFDTERKALLGMIDRLTARNAPQPTEEQRDQIQEKLAEGDYKGVAELLRAEARQEITPERAYIAQVRAINEARAIVPDLATYEPQVAEMLKNDPVALELSRIGNHKYASQVIAALAFKVKSDALAKENADLKASVDARVRKAIDETQKRIRNLPSSTSHVGKTPTQTASDTAKPLRQVMEEAWIAAGGSS